MTLGGRRLAVAFGLALVFWGLPIALIGSPADLAFAVGMLAVVGAAKQHRRTWRASRCLQRLVPDQLLTRVLGVTWSLAMGGVAVGSIAARCSSRRSDHARHWLSSAPFCRCFRSGVPTARADR